MWLWSSWIQVLKECHQDPFLLCFPSGLLRFWIGVPLWHSSVLLRGNVISFLMVPESEGQSSLAPLAHSGRRSILEPVILAGEHGD